ncbi:MAG TPA: DUF3775 domain-containing protein [Rhizomicrobium sp.]|nr:DUF3775 domain-containing protein [Rhizomicrobium sp.]
MLGINPEKVRRVIAGARVFDAKEGDSDPDSGSNPTDDGQADILEDKPDDATPAVLADYIRELDEDEQVELVALAWVGRGTYGADEWDDAVAEARRAHNKRTAEYLFSLPMLGDYLEEGLSLIEDEDANEIEDTERE